MRSENVIALVEKEQRVRVCRGPLLERVLDVLPCCAAAEPRFEIGVAAPNRRNSSSCAGLHELVLAGELKGDVFEGHNGVQGTNKC